MDSIFKKLLIYSKLNFLYKAQNTIVSAAFVLALSGGISAFLGLFKGRLLASYFGVSNALGVFYTADKIPNFIYTVIVVGGLSTVLIPIFSELLQKDKQKAYEAASSIITAGTATFIVISILVYAFAQDIIKILSLGNFTAEEVQLGVQLIRVMVFSQAILVVSSFLTSLLQSYKYFTVTALAPVLYNLGMILGIVLLSDKYGIMGPAIGSIIGAVLHLCIQIPMFFTLDFRFTPNLNFRDKAFYEVFTLLPPRLLSVCATQLVYTINNSLAILVSTSSVVMLKFASQVQFFPVHLFGASMASAALPVLSEHSEKEDLRRFGKIFITTLHQTMFFVMPASMILIVLRIPIIRLIYGVGSFPWEATVKTAYVLAFFSISIFSQSAVYLITRAFYALKDTITPVKVMALTILVNIAISYVGVSYFKLGIWIIALAYSFTSILDAGILLILLLKKLSITDYGQIVGPFTKISYATLFMGASIYIPLKLLDQLVFDTTRTLGLIILTGTVVILGSLSYLIFTILLRVEEIQLLYKLLAKMKLSKNHIIPSLSVEEHRNNI